VKVVDWEQRAPEIAGELSKGDGQVHLSTKKAKIFYTNLLLEALGKPTLEG
jgi:DNA integrity scanning protein DisA with diadenylate cyclase activity